MRPARCSWPAQRRVVRGDGVPPCDGAHERRAPLFVVDGEQDLLREAARYRVRSERVRTLAQHLPRLSLPRRREGALRACEKGGRDARVRARSEVRRLPDAAGHGADRHARRVESTSESGASRHFDFYTGC